MLKRSKLLRHIVNLSNHPPLLRCVSTRTCAATPGWCRGVGRGWSDWTVSRVWSAPLQKTWWARAGPMWTPSRMSKLWARTYSRSSSSPWGHKVDHADTPAVWLQRTTSMKSRFLNDRKKVRGGLNCIRPAGFKTRAQQQLSVPEGLAGSWTSTSHLNSWTL